MHDELLATAVRAARAAAPILLRWFGEADLEVRTKAANDFVSRADHESEEKLLAVIRAAHPDHHVLAEESGASPGDRSAHEWLLDPLDGTSNFVQGLPYFAISVACRRGEEMLAAAILEPVGGRLFTAAAGGGAWLDGRPIRVSERPGLAGAFLATGYPFKAHRALDLYLEVFREVFRQARAIRRCGAAALDLAYTAAGVYDGFFEFRLAPWDLAAGSLLVREAGGRVSDLDGGDGYLQGGNLIAGSPAVHRELLAAVARHADEAEIDRLDPRAAVAAWDAKLA